MPRPRTGYQLPNGEKVPGVTTILNRFKDSGGLIYWSWEQGKAGKDFREERDRAADAGTLAHALVEASLKGEDTSELLARADPEIIPGAQQGFQNWLNWRDQTQMVVEPWEKPIVCPLYEFGGTPDTTFMLNGVRALGDWKSGGLYVENLLQLAAYHHLLIHDAGIEIKGGFHLVRFSREHGDFSHLYFTELDDAWGMFLILRKAYTLDKLLVKRI